MIGWGILLIIMGIGSFILPQFNIQLQLMKLLENAQPAAGIVVAAIGALLVVIGVRKNRNAELVRKLKIINDARDRRGEEP